MKGMRHFIIYRTTWKRNQAYNWNCNREDQAKWIRKEIHRDLNKEMKQIWQSTTNQSTIWDEKNRSERLIGMMTRRAGMSQKTWTKMAVVTGDASLKTRDADPKRGTKSGTRTLFFTDWKCLSHNRRRRAWTTSKKMNEIWLDLKPRSRSRTWKRRTTPEMWTEPARNQNQRRRTRDEWPQGRATETVMEATSKVYNRSENHDWRSNELESEVAEARDWESIIRKNSRIRKWEWEIE